MKIFSGIRPTGDIHIGNYLGAIKQWVELQKSNNCVFCIVDWHAIVTPYEPSKIMEHIYDLAIAYITAGIDYKKNVFFVQSQVKEHVELAWLLGSITPTGELFRMTQYKEKSKDLKANVAAGLLNYPILMAADILLYQTDVVPVGHDQIQHVEFARELARKFNKKFGKVFTMPKPYISKSGARIKSLQDPRKKMSKSGNPKGCIGLFDSPQTIKARVMAAVTDTGKEIKYSPVKKPGISNLLTIYALFSNQSIKEIEKQFQEKGYAEFKKSLAYLLIESLKPFRKAKKELSREQLQKILDNGAKRARKIAQETIVRARKNMGLS